MIKMIVVYYSRSGNTKMMAEAIAKGAIAAGANVVVKSVDKVDSREFLDYDIIAIGSPTYYGHSAGVVRSLIDDSVKIHGRLDGKVGGAFASSGCKAGGNETTVLDILHAMLIHGMIVKGNFNGDHYGPVSICKPEDKDIEDCIKYGKALVALAQKVIK